MIGIRKRYERIKCGLWFFKHKDIHDHIGFSICIPLWYYKRRMYHWYDVNLDEEVCNYGSRMGYFRFMFEIVYTKYEDSFGDERRHIFPPVLSMRYIQLPTIKTILHSKLVKV